MSKCSKFYFGSKKEGVLAYELYVPTLESIRRELVSSPPGQGVMGMHIEDMYNAPFNTVFLLVQLERAQMPKRKRRRQPPVEVRMQQIIAKIYKQYSEAKGAEKKAA
jgi:hypothetical protein